VAAKRAMPAETLILRDCASQVNLVVSSTRPDKQSAQFHSAIKQGDLLLNRLQKLSRVINV